MTNRESNTMQEDISRAEARLAELDEERDRASQHISELKARLSSIQKTDDQRRPMRQTSLPSESTPLSSKQKLALFMELFRGRTDVYPKRWVNTKKGTKGYSPACSNEWVRGVCDKGKVKCGECPNQAFIPVTEKTFHDQFKGHHEIGVYPMLEDETCWFLAVDFDKGQWREDVTAFVETCKSNGVPFAVERSRSGNGAHVWFFLTAPVIASTARKMGCFLVTETMSRRHELPMTSYDRFFPNQDTMPRGGFGNLIALPFQDGPRQQGNSVFVDETWTPFPDQWVFLATIRRMLPADVETIAREAGKKDLIIGARMSEAIEDEDSTAPWMRPPSRRRPKPVIKDPLPPSVQAVLSQLLFVETSGMPSPLINQIKRLAAFQNPEFYKKQAMRLPTRDTPRVIYCAEDHPQHVALPRGCVPDLEELLADLGVGLSIEDNRTDGDNLDVTFHGALTPIQDKVVGAMLAHEIGVFVAPPGSGKTVVGANLIARRKRSTLVLVHRTQLLEQWIAQLSLFLDLKPKEIGRIGGGNRKPNGKLDVAMVQSLVRKDVVNDIVATYGHVIIDECHHVSAVSFEKVMREVKARYIVGLTATPRRRDGHHPISQLQLGPARFTINAKDQAATRSFDHKLIVRDTEFQLTSDITGASIQKIYGQLAQDQRRNQLILSDVVQALETGRSPILLTERRDHLDYFSKELHGLSRNLIILHGGMKTKDRRAAIAKLTSIPETEERLVLATGRFIGEGFDDARLDTLFLAMPVSWKGTLVQYAGRLHRKHHAKTEVRVMDYVDRNVPMLAKMFDKRMSGYRAMGYSVGDHASPEYVDDDYVIEYDQEALRKIEDEDF
jgi:superfamily II DNA or RNA helicase